MATAKRVPASMVAKQTEKMKQAKKITGSATSGFKSPSSSMAKKPVAKPTVTPKKSPTAVNKLPSVEDYRKSAAFKTNSMSYKEYLDIAKAQQSAKAKANKNK